MVSPNIQIIRPGETRKRFHRRPNFPIAGTMKPFGLYPIMAHPVLPGETLKSASTKWSVVSMPLVHPLAGAWLESWLFYVKLTDIDRDLGGMFISDTFSSSGWTAGVDRPRLHVKSGEIKWMEMMIDRIREAYFLNEGETAVDLGSPDQNIPKVKLNMRSWYQNLMFEPAEVAIDTTGEMDHRQQMSAWQMLQLAQMTELTYESYLEQYGVQSMKLGIGEPEILRFSRSWTKPVNHIDTSSGSPTSAWVWNDEMKLEKDKRFEEPGFVIMCSAIRPKMFQFGQESSLIGSLWGFTDWYPAYNLTDPTAGIKRIGTDDSVFISTLNDAEGEVQLLYDHRDLLAHGEQFINNRSHTFTPPFAKEMKTTAASPPTTVRGEYATDDDIDALFVGTADADELCYYEGIVGLTIAGHVTDTTA